MGLSIRHSAAHPCLVSRRCRTNVTPEDAVAFVHQLKNMFRLIQSAAKKSVRSQPAQRVARRNFGSDANVTYEGAEAVVRQYLPKDEQIVAAYIGLIATGILISKMTGSSKEEEAVTAVAGDAGPVDMVPSMFSDKFDDFISQPGNEAAFEKSCDEFEEWMKVPGNAAKYEAQFN